MPKQMKKDNLELVDQQDFDFISQKSTALLLSSPKGARKLIFIIFVFFAFAIYWAANAQVDEITKGDGKVISSKQLQKLQSLEGGIISDVLISSGDRISKDDILLVIDDTKFKSNLEEIRKKLLILEAQKESFSSELKDEPLVFSADLINEIPVIAQQEMDFFATRQEGKDSIELIYENRIEKLDNNFAEFTGKADNLRKKLELAEKELEEIRKKLLILEAQKESFSSELSDEPLVFSEDLSNELPVITKQEMDFFATRQKEKESIELTYKNQIKKLDNSFTEYTGKAENLRKNIELAEEEIEIYRSLQDNNLVSKVELIALEKELNTIKGELFQSEIKAKQIETLKTEALNERDNSNLVIKNEIYKYLQNKDLVSKVELISLEKELNTIKGELFQSEIKAKQIETLKTEALNERDNSNLSMRNKAQEKLKSTLAEIEILKQSEVVALDRLNRTLIRSPVNGIVQRVLTSTISSVISPGEDLIEIVPIDDALLIEAKIRPIDIGFLSPGQDVIVKFSAYDFAIYGGLNGNLEYISADTIVNENESYYLIKVRTELNYLDSENERLEIIPGMTASVNIVTGKKSVLDYLLKPVLRAKHNSLHER
ncbi:MAG: HlyD family type I secretion periplasmic adaptor subunit [Candidatus Thioglobus sp.]|nr:HlyD family type I secretion periplasmic adaptor subunit [Candidatus Thioglobus sp.]